MFLSSLFTFVASAIAVAAAPGPPLTKRETYIGCSTDQQTAIAAAASAADAYVADSNTFLTTYPGATARYETWFGAYSTTNFDSVQAAFSILGVNPFADWTYNCATCGAADIPAYVVSNSPYNLIFLCLPYWSLPDTSSAADSKAGILIQQGLVLNAGLTVDTVGKVPCIQLAETDADAAVVNPDNYEYFAVDPRPDP